jgi:hypothetical protein
MEAAHRPANAPAIRSQAAASSPAAANSRPTFAWKDSAAFGSINTPKRGQAERRNLPRHRS